MSDNDLSYAHPSFTGLIGTGRRDITPPAGIYARLWGAATADQAEGVHRPLTATALILYNRDNDSPLVLISLDLGWWKRVEDEWYLRSRVLEQLGIDESRVLITLSHTHAGPSTSPEDADQPGGSLIAPYLSSVAGAVVSAVKDAVTTSEEASLSWGQGSCHLAQNRDLFDGNRHACGFNPHGKADDTLLVGRVTTARGQVLATLVNYACHPTTLAWQNRLISPDFVGAMRELVESETGGAPCLFLQGACGELAPREQYTGDPAVADRHGRALGYAVLSVLEEMLPHSTALRYGGVVESGAQVGVWEQQIVSPSEVLRAVQLDVVLPLKQSWKATEADQHWEVTEDRVLSERLKRKRQIQEAIDGGRVSLWLWRLGDVMVIAQPNEAYSWLQIELRRRFNDHTLVIMNQTNGVGPGYLPVAGIYDAEDLYQVWQTPYARGSLEYLADAIEQGIREHLLG